MRFQNNIVNGLCLLTIFFFISCATYYQQRLHFQKDFERGNVEAAQKFLKKQKKAEEGKDRLLYFLDRGVVEQMIGNYDSSNYYFEQAYYYNQDYVKSLGADIASYITNPMVKPYKSEDFEEVLVHYYKAINFINKHQLDDALIEVRRINISLNRISDRYEGKRFRYKEDAFAHLLMGVIYEAKQDYNNAFIAYRNAYNTYESVYGEFGVEIPLQLKKDLLRAAHYTGFYEEVDFYERKFNLKAERREEGKGTLVFFWMNGLVPVKGEISLNFSNNGGSGGTFVLSDDQSGMSFPIIVNDPYERSDLSELKVVRVAIPKFNRRDPLYTSASLIEQDTAVELELTENINNIAIASLEDRIFRELASTIGRVAVKQAAAAAAREKDEGLGTAVSLINALTEKADTRNWQTLPNQISYQRIDLEEGEHLIKLATRSAQIANDTVNFNIPIRANRTVFQTYHSLSSTTLN